MALAPGTRIGPYEITAPLGVGGMGEVYRATDTNLKRQVAIKVLPAALAADPDRLARFQREAEVLARLNHPNIAHIHGLDKSGGNVALVMELVEGSTLASRILQGPISIEDALPIALQIAEALEAAHEQNIVHRDLKPANIKLRDDGTVKILDFGLAKALEPASAVSSALTDSPTITSPAMLSSVGMLLGTAAYMSPEQAKGRTADERSDVWAFGCVLYEMLTGKRAFEGEDLSDTLAAVLRGAPDWGVLPPATPSGIVKLLRGCLQKDRTERVPDIAVARFEIKDALNAPAENLAAAVPHVAAAPRPLWKRAVPIILTAVVVAAIAGAATWTLKPAPPLPPVSRFALTLGEGQQFGMANYQNLTISPDGSLIAYVANGQVYLRSMADLESRAISGTQKTVPNTPVFSPDGRSIAFFSIVDKAIKRIPVSGGAAITICPTETPVLGMSWKDGELLFGQQVKGILGVSDTGGRPQTIITPTDQEILYGPQMLPGGEWVLFTSAAIATAEGWNKAQIVVQSRKSGRRRILIPGGSDARYLQTGHIIFAVVGVEFAVPFDLRHLTVGAPVRIVEGVRRSFLGLSAATQIDVSENGSLVFEPGPASVPQIQTDVALIDPATGQVQAFKLPAGAYQYPRVSPNGQRIAFESDDGKDATVWTYELSGAGPARHLTMGGRNRYPVWADSDRVAFQSDREGDLAIFWQRADGTGTATRLTRPDDKDTAHIPESSTHDGKTLLFNISKKSSNSLYSLSLSDKIVKGLGIESASLPNATVSPDGSWVAYTVAPTRSVVGPLFVKPFPVTETTYEVSTGPGLHPVWGPRGESLIYAPGFRQLASVSVTTKPTFTPGKLTQLNGSSMIEPGPTFETPYDMMPDGRLLTVIPADGNTALDATVAPQMQVWFNWFQELKQRVPAR
jgi:serine/threonine-protein kinase